MTKNWFGDVIFEEPFLRALKGLYPDSHITCITAPRCKDILEAHPFVDEVMLFDDRTVDKSLIKKMKFVRALSKRQFTKGFLLHRSLSRACILALARVRARYGYATKGRAFLLTHPVKEPAQKIHRVDYLLNLLSLSHFTPSEETRQYRFYFSENDASRVDALLKRIGLAGASFLCINPGANWDKKRWPAEKFVQCIQGIRKKSTVPILVTGGEMDRELARLIVQDSDAQGVIDVTGETSLCELGALFVRSRCVITADSGPMHIAAGVGTTVIALFGPTDSVETGPRGIGESVILSATPERCTTPCFDMHCTDNECMRSLAAERVVHTLIEKGLI
jgi:lipopolysaccharide heptosyltransferase II